MITFKQKGDFSKLTHFLQNAKNSIAVDILDKYGREGVKALASATPLFCNTDTLPEMAVGYKVKITSIRLFARYSIN